MTQLGNPIKPVIKSLLRLKEIKWKPFTRRRETEHSEQELPMTMTQLRPHHRHISPTTVILIFTLLIFSSVSVISRMVEHVPKNDWDVLIFTQNWPNTVCLEWHEKSKGSACVMPSDSKSWTVHGVWPTKLGTIGPGFCNPSLHFNEEEIYGIEDELEKRWTPIEKHKKKNTFWKHEWEKHGTCASVLDDLSSEFKYFYKGLEWNKDYEMGSVLEKAGIIADQERGYDVQEVWQKVRSVLGVNPFIMCYVEPKTKKSFLQEIRICFSKDLKLVDCDGIKLTEGADFELPLIDCPTSSPVLYLKSLPSHFYSDRPSDPSYVTAYKTIKFLQWLTA